MQSEPWDNDGHVLLVNGGGVPRTGPHRTHGRRSGGGAHFLRGHFARARPAAAGARARREAFRLAAARAVARAGIAAEYLSPLVAVGGRLLTFKGPKVGEELGEVRGRWRRLGLAEPVVRPYGPEESSRCFVTWEKTAPCPREYPRRAGTASMKGWWL